MNGSTSPGEPSFRSSPGATNGVIAPPTSNTPHAASRNRPRHAETMRLSCRRFAGGVVLRDEPHQTRRDTEIEEGEIRQDAFDNAPDAIAGVAERADEVWREEEADRKRGRERQPVRDGADEKRTMGANVHVPQGDLSHAM